MEISRRACNRISKKIPYKVIEKSPSMATVEELIILGESKGYTHQISDSDMTCIVDYFMYHDVTLGDLSYMLGQNKNYDGGIITTVVKFGGEYHAFNGCGISELL